MHGGLRMNFWQSGQALRGIAERSACLNEPLYCMDKYRRLLTIEKAIHHHTCSCLCIGPEQNNLSLRASFSLQVYCLQTLSL